MIGGDQSMQTRMHGWILIRNHHPIYIQMHIQISDNSQKLMHYSDHSQKLASADVPPTM